MGPLLDMWSIVDQFIGMWYMTVYTLYEFSNIKIIHKGVNDTSCERLSCHSTLTSRIGGLLAGCSASDLAPCYCAWESTKDGSGTWAPIKPVGDQERASGSWLWLGPDLAVTSIWGGSPVCSLLLLHPLSPFLHPSLLNS